MNYKSWKTKLIDWIRRELNINISKAYPILATLIAKKHLGNKEILVSEVGVLYGENAVSMIKELRIKKLFLVDPYTPYIQDDEGNHWVFTQQDMNKIKSVADKKLRRYKNKIKRVFKTSEEASKDFKDNYFDYVYIDGNHEYKYVIADLENWYPKVKSGGIFAGDDFETKDVAKAVFEFTNKKGINFNTRGGDWFIIK